MKIPYFDTHCDTASKMLGRCGLRANELQLDLERGVKFSPRGQIFALFADNGSCDDYLSQRDNLLAEIERNSDIVSFCKNGRDAEVAYSSGKMAAFMSVEGAELLNCSIEQLEAAYNDGVCAVTLTWDHANLLSGSNADENDKGLTELGREFVKNCNRLGVLVDVSHLSDKGFWDVMEITTEPIVATHSNSRNVWFHTRSLTDDMFKELIKTGGIVGLNLYGNFLGAVPDIAAVLRHIGHFLDLGGEKHLTIGADFDGCKLLPAEINGIEDMELLYREIENNFGKCIAENIYFNNAMALLNRM